MDDSAENPSTYSRALACYEAGQYRETHKLCEQLLAHASPTAEVFHLSGNAYRREGDLDRAIEQLKLARAHDASSPSILGDLATALLQAGQFNDALTLCHSGLELSPRHGQFFFLIGYAHHAQGNVEEAESSFRKAAELEPDHAPVLINLANAQYALEKYEEAANGYLRALELSPEIAETHYNLAGAWRKLGKHRQALDRIKTALQLRPGYALAHKRLGDLRGDLGEHTDALVCYQTALKLGAENADTFYGLGLSHRRIGNLDAAVANLQQALKLRPASAEFLNSLGNAYVEQGQLDKAMTCFEQAFKLEPDSNQSLCSLIHQKMACGCWSGFDDLTQRLLNGIDQGVIHVAPFDVLSLPTTAQQQRRAAEAHLARRIEASVHSDAKFRFASERRPKSRIKLGYLSGDFRRHPVTSLMQRVIELHNRQDFELYAFSSGPDEDSNARRQIAASFDQFVDLRADSHHAAASRIHERGIDILVDLSGHTQGCRPEVLALRPAPIQVLYLGYPGTTGSSYIDYLLVDDFAVPRNLQPFFTERLVHLPGCFLPINQAREVSNRAPSRTEFDLPEYGFVFCSFSNSYKILPQMFDVWMELLRQTPHSVLWLAEGNPYFPDRLRSEARRRGVATDRLVFASRLPELEDHLRRYQVVDLFLDTFPYNAHSTAVDALLAGCPLLTLTGQTFASRVAGSVLHAVGLPELITGNLEAYQSMALRLTADRSLLSAFKSRLMNRDLSNVERLTRDLERAYQSMWQRYLAGTRPEAFSIPAG